MLATSFDQQVESSRLDEFTVREREHGSRLVHPVLAGRSMDSG
jgi:hypothetical protein